MWSRGITRVSNGAQRPAAPPLVRAASTHWGSYQAASNQSPQSFYVERGVSVDRSLSSPISSPLITTRLRKSWKPKQWRPRGQNPLHALLRVEKHGGARVININAGSTTNRLDIITVKALTQMLHMYESNPMITLITIRGDSDGVFCTGTDLDELKRACASADSRGSALAYLRAQIELQHTIANYTKPLVAGMHGLTVGSGYALAANAKFSYATDNAIVSLPEVTKGLLPHSGSSYHLSRLDNGFGMYLALTGAVLQGSDVYWGGLAPLYGLSSAREWSNSIMHAAGEVSLSPSPAWDMGSDPLYHRTLRELRDSRADLKMQHVTDNMNEDVSREVFDYYVRLKRWYGFIAAGDKLSAKATLASERADEEGPAGDLFDFGQSEAVNGRDTLYEPRFASEARRATYGAVAGYAQAVGRGALDAGPDPTFLAKMKVVQRAFGGRSGDPVLLTVADNPRPQLTREQVQSAAVARKASLPPNWEATALGVSVSDCVMAVYERMEIVPVDIETQAFVNAVRLGVTRAWPMGSLSQLQLEDVCYSLGVPDRQQARDIVSRGIAYATARLLRQHKRSDSNVWVLEDPAIVARERKAVEATERARYAGISLPSDAGSTSSSSGGGGSSSSVSALMSGDFEVDGGPPGTPRLVSPGVEEVYYDPQDDDFWHQLEREEWEKPTYAPPLEPSETSDGISTAHAPMSNTPVATSEKLLSMRYDLCRLVARLPLGGLSLYTDALETAQAAALKKEYSGQRVDGGIAPLRTALESRVGLDIPTKTGGTRKRDPAAVEAALTEMSDVLVQLRVHAIKAMIATSGPVVQARLALSESDIAAMAALHLGQSEAAPRIAKEAAEASGNGVTRRHVLAWNTLQKALVRREQLAAAARDSAAAHASAATTTAAPSSTTSTGVLSMPSESVSAVQALVARYAALEVEALGAAEATGIPAALTVPEVNPDIAANDVYVVARDPVDGSLTLARRPVGTAFTLTNTGSSGSGQVAVGASAPGTSTASGSGSGSGSVSGQSSPPPPPNYDSLLGVGGGGTRALGSSIGRAEESSTVSSMLAASNPAAQLAQLDNDVPSWEPHHICRALTEPDYLLSTFKLPSTPHTRAAAARVVDSFKEEADGRVAVPHPKSVDVIVSRLRSIIAGAGKSDTKSGELEGQFASQVLKQLTSLPGENVRAVHALLANSSQLSLRQAMRAEFRGITRLASGFVDLKAAAHESASASDIAATLFSPFASGQRSLDIPLPRRREAAEQGARHAKELESWLAALPAAYESGLHTGALGDVMRRRYSWFKAPLEEWDGGEGLDEEEYVGRTESQLDELSGEVEKDASTFDKRSQDDGMFASHGIDSEFFALKNATRADLQQWVAQLEMESPSDRDLK